MKYFITIICLLPIMVFADSTFTVNVDSQMEVRGYDDASQAEKRIESKLYSIKNCYLDSFKNDQSFKKVTSTLRFSITPDGVSRGISIKSNSKKAKTMEACIVEKTKGWSFPKPEKNNASAEVEFIFKGDLTPTP